MVKLASRSLIPNSPLFLQEANKKIDRLPLPPLHHLEEDITKIFLHRMATRNYQILLEAMGKRQRLPTNIGEHVLSSPHMFAILFQDYFIRNNSRASFEEMNAIMSQFMQSDSPFWYSIRYQRPILQCYDSMERSLKRMIEYLQPIAKYKEDVKKQIEKLNEVLVSLKAVRSGVEPHLHEVNIHPEEGNQEGLAGFHISIRGPRKDQMAISLQHRVGKSGHDYVTERSTNDFYSFIGVYGLSLELIYQKKDKYIGKELELKGDRNIKPFKMAPKKFAYYS